MKNEVTRLLAYMVSSATGCLSEPRIYGPLRLLEAMEKLIRLMSDHELICDKKLLGIMERIEEGKLWCLTDEDAFSELLNGISRELSEIIDID